MTRNQKRRVRAALHQLKTALKLDEMRESKPALPSKLITNYNRLGFYR